MAQILIAGNDAALGASTNYYPIQGHAASQATEAAAAQVMPTAGTLSLLALKSTGTVSGTTVGTLYVNGSATALTASVTGVTPAHDNTHSVSVSAGDTVSFQLVIPGGASSRAYSHSMKFTPTVAGETILMGTTGTNAIAANDFMMVGGSLASNATAANATVIIPETGTLKKMYIKVASDPTVTGSITFTSQNNGSAGNLTCTISSGSTTANDTTHTDTIASAGNTFSIKVTTTLAPTLSDCHYGVVYVSPTSGNFLIPSRSIGGISNAGTRYIPVSGARSSTTTDTNMRYISNAFTAKSVWLKLTTAPGTGKSWDFCLRQNGSNTAELVTISDAATTGNTTTDVTIALDDLLNNQSVPTSTPTGATIQQTLVGYLADPNTSTNFFLMF